MEIIKTTLDGSRPPEKNELMWANISLSINDGLLKVRVRPFQKKNPSLPTWSNPNFRRKKWAISRLAKSQRSVTTR